MRVLHVYSGNLFGGIESILTALARGAAVCPDVVPEFALCFEGRLAGELAAHGARVHHLGAVRASRPQSVRTARRALAGLLRSSPFDRVVCHAPWAHGLFGGVVRRAGTPLVFWAHDVAAGRHWTERLARRVPPDLAICNSAFTAGTMARLFPGAPTTVVYAPVERSRATGDWDRRTVRESLGTGRTTVVIALASRSEPWKGHRLLIDALAELRDVPDWAWWQIGGAQRPSEAAYLESLRAMARRAGIADRVRWLGERTDVPRLLGAADLYCQPNLEPEPFGVVFVEALAAGLPAIGTALGGVNEIVDDTCGVLVPPDDPRALADVLRRLIGDEGERRRLAAVAPTRARALCDAATQVGRLRDVLEAMQPAEARA